MKKKELLVQYDTLMAKNSESDENSLQYQYILTYWGRVTQIYVFTLQLCKTDDANLRF